MHKVVWIRHGQSVWNLENRFTGWTDVDLTDRGLEEARRAGELLKANGFAFDEAHTSLLKRAIRTMWIVLHEMDLAWIPEHKTWMLNERHYGALQGLNKAETAAKYGEEQVREWRRSAQVRPPALDEGDARNAAADPRYLHVPKSAIPLTENLEDTGKRALAYWRETIAPAVRSGRRVLVSAHGNTIRAMIQYLDRIPGDGIASIDVPTGVPLVYELDDDLNAIRRYYLEAPN